MSKKMCSICILGASGVGKSSILLKAKYKLFSEKHLATLCNKQIDFELSPDSEIVLSVHDCTGVNEYQCTNYGLFKKMDAFVVVADSTRDNTFKVATVAVKEIYEYNPNAIVFSVINKADLSGGWQSNAEIFNKNKENIVSVSAKSGENIDKLFQLIEDSLTTKKNNISKTVREISI